jgi:hypothetical protein
VTSLALRPTGYACCCLHVAPGKAWPMKSSPSGRPRGRGSESGRWMKRLRSRTRRAPGGADRLLMTLSPASPPGPRLRRRGGAAAPNGRRDGVIRRALRLVAPRIVGGHMSPVSATLVAPLRALSVAARVGVPHRHVRLHLVDLLHLRGGSSAAAASLGVMARPGPSPESVTHTRDAHTPGPGLDRQ